MFYGLLSEQQTIKSVKMVAHANWKTVLVDKNEFSTWFQLHG